MEVGRKLNVSSPDILTAETQNMRHIDTTRQQGGSDKLSQQCSNKGLCKWVMTKANSLNEVNSRDFDAAAKVTCAHVSLDAESVPTANRKRRNHNRNNAQNVSGNNNNTIIIIN